MDLPERVFLEAGVKRIEPLLRGYGFQYGPGDEGCSSGGSFATGTFWRGDFEIGLIVREKAKFGAPDYSFEKQGFVGHDELMRTLGRGEEARLVPGLRQSFVARDGSDPFDALRWDLEQFILPVFKRSEVGFRTLLSRANG